MFYDWQHDGKIPPEVKLKLIGPGMPGQPMYYVAPAKAANPKMAEEFIALAPYFNDILESYERKVQ